MHHSCVSLVFFFIDSASTEIYTLSLHDALPIYWGSWDGYEHATDLNGNQVWQTFLGTNSVATGCHPPEAGVASIPDVTSVNINGTMTTVVYVGGGDANFYAWIAATVAGICKKA